MALLDLLFSLLGSQATAEPCGPSVWCREDVQCSFVQLPVATLGEQTFTVPYAAGPAWPRVLDTDCTISHQPLESQELLSYYSSHGDITAAGSLDAEVALIVSHGAVPNPGGYFCAGMDAVAMQQGVDPSRVVVIAPWYLGSGADTPPTATQLQWTDAAHSPLSGNWRDGADSDPAGGRPGDISSYRVLDLLVERLLLSGAFPALRGATLWGDSAGGQVLSRYALTTHLPNAALQRIRILPSNPSSFPYVDGRRWNYTLVDGQCQLGELRVPDLSVVDACPDYDSWRYGIADLLPPYVAKGLDLERFPNLAVTYVQGSQDVCNEDGTCATESCGSGGLDRGCEAMQQGPMRLWRGQQYKAALDVFYSKPTHRLLVLPGVGHDAYQIARHPSFLVAAFNDWELVQLDIANKTTK